MIKLNLEFKSIKELYDSILPALRTKKYELKKLGYLVSEADIWNYLTSTKWIKSINLTLSEMVNDIFLVNGNDISNYLINKIPSDIREPYFE